MAKKKIPQFMQSALWSYKLDAFDLDNEADKRIIIMQVLNHGTWEQLQWLLETYTVHDIQQVVKKPQRGQWYKDVLNYWLNVLNISLPVKTHKQAILTINPTTHASINS